MTIDALADAIKASSSEELAQRLANLLLEWKQDDTSVEALRTTISWFIGHSWFSANEVHNHICELWSAFTISSIDGIQGMTMNERLYSFGLITRFDSATTDDARKVIYAKLLARA